MRGRAARAIVLRRHALALLAALAAAACGARPSTPEPARVPAPDPLKLDPLVDVVPVAGLVWLVDARPQELFTSPVLGKVLTTVLPDERFVAFAARHGGVDARRIDRLAIAGYPQTTLVLARTQYEPVRVEAAFAARAEIIEGRTAERGVRRIWGSVHGSAVQLAFLARDAIAIERGRSGPLRAAVYFAEQRLRHSLPALRAEPLASAAALAGDAPLRMFAAGPFDQKWARGAAGLLQATTAVAAAIAPDAGPRGGAVALRLFLTGAWGEDAPAAAERLRSAFGVLAADPLGHLLGLDRPVEGPTVSEQAGALRLDVSFDAMALARGVHSALDASVAQIMAD